MTLDYILGTKAKQKTAIELLSCRSQWQLAPEFIQDRAVELVDEKLGGAYCHVETKVCTCGGQSHRIATFRHKKTGMLFNLIPGGTYRMGSDDGYDAEKPAHDVTIPPLLVGRTPLRQRAWDAIGGEHKRRWSGPDRPIEGVSWNDVKAWLKKAGDGLRLLSESEWEYACRAGTTTKWSHGDDESSLKDYAWYDANAGETQPVGGREPNAFGLYDMHGNVWEWCEDDWIVSYASGPNDHLPRRKRGAAKRVVRGGSWVHSAGSLRSANRGGSAPGERSRNLGARLARSI